MQHRIVGDGEGGREVDGWPRAAAVDGRENRVPFTRHGDGDSNFQGMDSHGLDAVIVCQDGIQRG